MHAAPELTNPHTHWVNHLQESSNMMEADMLPQKEEEEISSYIQIHVKVKNDVENDPW